MNDNKKPLLKYAGLLIGVYLIGLILLIGLDSVSFLKNNALVQFIKYPYTLSKSVLEQLYRDTDLETPLRDGGLPNGADVPHQWKGKLGPYVLVGKNNIQTYAKPSKHATPYLMLQGAQRVRVVYVSPKSTSVDGVETRWVFVTDEAGRTPLGWVQNAYLGYSNSFRKMSFWDLENFGFCKGDYCAEYTVNLDGRYSAAWVSQSKSIFLEGKSKGHFYQFQNVMVALQDEREFFLDIFFLPDEGEFRQEHKYETLPIKFLK